MELTRNDIKQIALDMASEVEMILKASQEADVTLEQLFEIERRINQYHKDIDDKVFKYIALMNPHAKDLRMALAVMKMNSELERIGDQAVNIKRYLRKLKSERAGLKSLYDNVMNNYTSCLKAFKEKDTHLATEVIKFDEHINEINKENIQEIVSHASELPFEEAMAIMRISKNLERIGDHITNIAEDIIFLESGDDIRHNPDN